MISRLAHGAALRRWLLGGVCGAAFGAQAQAAADFTGVWQPVNPPLALHTITGAAPPLLPDARAVYDQHKAMLARGDVSFDRTRTRCAPPGEPRIMTEPMPFDIVQTRTQLLFGYQWNRLVRFVQLDAKMDVLSPFYFGTSTGHFDGATLVVEAEGFNDRFFLDRSGMPHSDQLKLTESFTLGKGGRTLQARIHVEDPKTFSAPWDTVLNFRKLPTTRIVEDICTMREKLVPPSLQFTEQ